MIEDALHLLSYDPDTGLFTWAVNHGRFKSGDIAGTVTDEGYISIKVMNKSYRAHRLAWLFSYGYVPKLVDHKNGIKSDNRLVNLRAATKSQNLQNSEVKRDGLKGAYLRKESGKWRAIIQIDGKLTHLGTYGTEEEAHEVYCLAAMKFFGEFANFGSNSPNWERTS